MLAAPRRDGSHARKDRSIRGLTGVVFCSCIDGTKVAAILMRAGRGVHGGALRAETDGPARLELHSDSRACRDPAPDIARWSCNKDLLEHVLFNPIHILRL